MKKSELKQIINEVVGEMFDPYDGVTQHPNVTKLDPSVAVEAKKAITILSQLHKKLNSAVVSKYGQEFKNFRIYMSVSSDGKPEIQIYASTKDTKKVLGGDLNVKIT